MSSKFSIFIITLFITLLYVSGDNGSSSSSAAAASDNLNHQTDTANDNSVITAENLIDYLINRVNFLSKLFDLKWRLARFIVSLYTTENLALLRKIIEYHIDLLSFLLRILPETASVTLDDIIEPIALKVFSVIYKLSATTTEQTNAPTQPLSSVITPGPTDVVPSKPQTTAEPNNIVNSPPVLYNARLLPTTDNAQNHIINANLYRKMPRDNRQQQLHYRVESLDRLIRARNFN